MARIQKENEEYLYNVYVTDALKAIAGNTAVFGGVGFMHRWVDIINQKVDTRSAEEIIEDVISNSGLEVIE